MLRRQSITIQLCHELATHREEIIYSHWTPFTSPNKMKHRKCLPRYLSEPVTKISKLLLSALKFTNVYVPTVMSCKIRCNSSVFVVNLLVADGFLFQIRFHSSSLQGECYKAEMEIFSNKVKGQDFLVCHRGIILLRLFSF